MSLETVSLEDKSVSALNVAYTADGSIFIWILPELSQLLMASFSCEPSLYFFTGRYSEPCRFRHYVAIGQLTLLHAVFQKNFGNWLKRYWLKRYFLLLIIISWNLGEIVHYWDIILFPIKFGSQILLTSVFSGLSKKKWHKIQTFLLEFSTNLYFQGNWI